MATVSCDTLKLSYTVNPLPSSSRDTTLQSLVVRYQPILGGGSTQSRTVPLNGNATEGVLCISGLTSNIGYRITYSVEVNGIQGSLPSDVPEPIEVSTSRTCDLQCQESRRTITTTTTPPATSCTTPPPPSCPRPTMTTPSTPQPTTTPSTPQPTTTSSTMTTTQPTTRPTAPTGELVQHLVQHGTACGALQYVFV